MRSHASNETVFTALAAAVRARRKSVALPQRELSQLAGCGLDFIYDVEAGKPTLRLNKLIDVLVVLGLELVLDEGKAGLSIARSLKDDER
jgi:HTH-type transcriptional regulator/antitoxin HipB